MVLARLRSFATLVHWLGPWADGTKAPRARVHDEVVDDLRVRVFHPVRRAAHGSYLIAPGLHPAGPDDPRMDRFCRILAASGYDVVAPFIPDYLALTPGPRALSDFVRVFHAMPRWTVHARPVVFSISFGSLLALALAAEHGDALGGVVIFGGYADLATTLRFCLTGEVANGRRAVHDPLNQPVVFANVLAHVDPPPRDAAALQAGWRRYVQQTWGRPEMKTRDRYVAVAEKLATSIHEADRELFLVGTGAHPGTRARAEAAIARFDARALDPSPYFGRIRGRVDLMHGTDDDVIPHEETLALARALSHADVRVHITGLYDHTGADRGARGMTRALREMATLANVLRALAT